MQRVYTVVLKDTSWAQALAVWEEAEYAAFFSDFFKFTDLQRICCFHQWQVFFKWCQSEEDLL